MRYGLPYMGSKNKIAQWVLSYLPQAENFYDLFCGGCAITHCAILQGKYKNYYINDIKGEMPQGFVDCLNGKYDKDYRWISHEDFDRLKGQGDLLVDCCFSFGNNWRKGYAYSREIEPYKKALHYAIFFEDYTQAKELIGIDLSVLSNYHDVETKYTKCKKIIVDNTNINRFDILSLERILSIERLQGLKQLENMTRLQGLIVPSGKSYHDIEVKPNSVIYCDIPYRSTSKYNEIEFDYDRFYSWALSQTEPIFISEYEMPNDFICIASKNKKVTLSATDNSSDKIEKIFVPKHQYSKTPKLTLF